LNFGNHEAMVALLKQMAYREGFGAVLADGCRQAARKIGTESEKYAMQVKGLELPAYDVRGAKAHGLNYATAFTGADHCRGYAFQEIFGVPIPHEVDRFSVEGKGALTMWNQDLRTATTDAPTMCAFLMDMTVPAVAAQNTASLMEAVTGLAFTAEAVQIVGERINNLARVFNTRAGLTRSDDTLPERLLTEPIPGGASKGHFISKEELNQMLDEYYAARGWHVETGAPTKEKLLSLGLDSAVD
jgi:aldehyde:ferredoxin oxidoreductase